jgi:hypothetical protein
LERRHGVEEKAHFTGKSTLPARRSYDDAVSLKKMLLRDNRCSQHGSIEFVGVIP